MKDRQIIVGLLHAVAARMRVARVLHETGFAVCVVLFALTVFQVIRMPLAGVISDLHRTVLVGGLVVFCLLVLSRALRRVSMAQAASLIDSKLPLHDELKSAYWFVSHQGELAEDGAAFVQAHVANAARTAQRLRDTNLMPLRLPRSMILAIVPGLMFVGAMWSSPEIVRAGTVPAATMAQTLSGARSARELLSATASDEDEILEIDKALATFERSDASAQEVQQAMTQVRDAIDQLNMRAAVTREGLARLAIAMRGQPGFEKVADAIEQGRTDEAIAMLQGLRGEPGALPGAETGSREQQAAVTERAEMGPGQDIGETARDLASMNGRINEESITRLLKNLEEAQETMRMQRRANAARSRMDEMGQMVGMTARASDQAPSAFSDQGERPMGTPSPDAGKSDLRGGTMYRQGAITPGDDEQGEDGSATGAPSGHAPAKALEGRATRRLDAVLKLEGVKVGSDQKDENAGQESAWFYSASQQEQSETAFANARGREDYAGADVMRPGRVPIQQRQAVRDYFINVHEGDNQ